MPSRRILIAWLCCRFFWEFSAPVCFGQVIEFPPQPAATQQPALVTAPIIQALPGAEGENPPVPAPASNEPAPLFTDSLTAETVQQRMKDAADDQSLDKSVKEKLLGLYQQALSDLSEAANQEAKAAEFLQKTQSVPAQIEEAKKAKQSLSKPVEAQIPGDASLVQLQQELTTREESLANAKKKLDEAVNALKGITANRGDLSQSRKTAQDRLAETEQQLKNLPAGNNITPQTRAERSLLRARWQLLRANLSRLDKEDAWRQARTELLPLERDIAALEAGRLETEVLAWRKAVTAERQSELDRQKAQAEAQAREALTFQNYPSITGHANEIVELAELRQKTAARIPIVVKQLDRTTNELKTLQDNFKQSRERVAAAADNAMNVGTMLRLQQNKLPNVRELERNIVARQEEIQQLQLASYEVNDRTKDLANVAKATEDLLDSLDPPPNENERLRLETFAAELLETEKSHLDDLNADYNVLNDKLWELDKAENQLSEETQRFSQFISEHVLWIKSTNALWNHPLDDFREAFAWLLRPEDWMSILTALGRDVWEQPGVWAFALAVFGLLFIQQKNRKERIDEIGRTINKRAITEFRPTVRVLYDTVLLAALWPALLCWVGHRLSGQLETPVLVPAVGTAMFATGMFYFPVELLRQSCRTNGLVQSHFTWPAPVVTMVRRNLRWFTMFVPVIWLATALLASPASRASGSHESLGRLFFIAALGLEALFMHRVLRPSGAAFRALIAHRPGGWVDRLKYVFYAAGVLVPLALACLAALGYHFTAGQLIIRFYATALLALSVLMIDALIQRWLLVTRRRLAMEQLRQRREAARAQVQGQQSAGGSSPSASQSPVIPNPVDVHDERLDVSAMNDQTRQLIRSLLFVGVVVGLWGVWVDVLPALAVLKNIKIHALTIERVIEEPVQVLSAVPGIQTAAASTEENASEMPPASTKRTVEVPITLADLILSIIILIAAIGAARNLPGMLEMIVLQRLPIDNAARYAISTLAQYGLMIVGISAAFYVIGLRWQNVQWLAAALMVGLGFGLQEIFANFFSGLIVLLERPVRVGDIVTVGNTTGIVTRIRMRASTITNWERQEMIIPNKDLITGTVLNWTLSDTIQRVFIQVGVAYGSDTDKATEVLYGVLKSHPQVMDEPPPLVTFSGFGDSTLNFELRCFLPTAAVKLSTTHELHMGIDKAFREAGIEIAFPQCDLHIRSVDSTIPFQQITHSNSTRTQETARSKGA